MKEKQTHLTIIRDDNGKVEKITIRGKAEIHSHCNAVHESNIGDHIFWHSNSHYTWPKVEGVIVAKTSMIWDYSLPVYNCNT